MTFVAGRIDVPAVMEELARRRPVFHSEADFQFAFAQVIQSLVPDAHIRLEVPLRGVRGLKGSQYLDLMCSSPAGRTAIELKYFTRSWTGTDGSTEEQFRLRHHAATDLARRNLVFDIARLEQFTGAGVADNGLALMLTNDRNLWLPSRRATSNDHEFHINEGVTLKGVLRWAKDLYPGNTRELTGKYPIRWNNYSELGGSHGAFRWLAIRVRKRPGAGESRVSFD
ncbi:hypothetical protein ACI8AV_17985 [Geodermatophilus sp. SYSU D00804]